MDAQAVLAWTVFGGTIFASYIADGLFNADLSASQCHPDRGVDSARTHSSACPEDAELNTRSRSRRRRTVRPLSSRNQVATFQTVRYSLAVARQSLQR